jgi:hypothetical protein
MRLGKFLKTPDEIKRYAVEYKHWLDTGEYLQAVTLEVIAQESTSVVLFVDAVEPSSTKAVFFVSGGDADETYDVLVKATTTGGQVKEDVIALAVRTP